MEIKFRVQHDPCADNSKSIQAEHTLTCQSWTYTRPCRPCHRCRESWPSKSEAGWVQASLPRPHCSGQRTSRREKLSLQANHEYFQTCYLKFAVLESSAKCYPPMLSFNEVQPAMCDEASSSALRCLQVGLRKVIVLYRYWRYCQLIVNSWN